MAVAGGVAVAVAVAVGCVTCGWWCLGGCGCVVHVYVYGGGGGGGGGVLLLVFRGKILGYVRRRTTTEPFTKDVVIDHERRLRELKTSTVVVLTTNHAD